MPSKDIPAKVGVLLLTVREAADILNVTPRTVLSWIAEDKVPYITLPGGHDKPSYRIPLHALVGSLSGTYDLAADLEVLIEGTSRPVK